MAWFGNVSLGNLDLAGAVNKLSESVKNIEKNFDSALGLEEKPATTSSEVSGIWPSASDRKTLFKPVMAFMGHRAGENAEEASGTEESSKHASSTEEIAGVSVEESLVPAVKVIAPEEKEAEESKLQENSGHDMNLNISPQLQESKVGAEAEVAAETEKAEAAAETETEAATEAEPEVNSEAEAETGAEIEGIAESEGKTETEEKAKAVSEAKTEAEDEANLIQADSELSGDGNINVVDSPPIGQGAVAAEVGTPDGSQLDNRSDRAKKMENNALHVADELPVTSDSEVSQDKQEQESELLPDTVSLLHTDVLDRGSVSLSSEASGVVSFVSHPESIVEVSSEPTFTSFEQSPDRETDSENKVGELSESQEMGAQRNDLATAKQEHSRITDVPSSVDSHIELDKVRKEMKLMEAALQGAARQAQSKADEIARLMNENEQLKSIIEDLKRKSSEAEVDVLRDEYHQRVAALERKVYALTRERDTLRREQSKKSDAAVLLKEKDEIISQVMAEGEELSKKQAAQESTIRKLRAQIREFEEEKQRLSSKLQVEETKVESIKKDKAATEKLLQETIEKNQAELAAQKEFYTNALNAAKEAEALAEARANNEARAELESRLREAGERESMLVQALEELRQTLSRTEQQAVFREDMLRRDIDDLQKRYQASELRYNELVTQVPESTRPLLRQIEAMQETAARRAEAWAGVERALNSRLQEAEAKAAAAEENERIMNERVSQSLSRITVLETQIACLRTEQAQLSRSLEKERQRASETRQEYLAAMEEAATQEGRAKQLEDEIKELRSKHKRVLQEEMSKTELLEKELERERNAREELQKNASRPIPRVGSQEHISKRSYTINDNGNVPKRKLSSATSLGNMEESDFLQASLDSSNSFHSERRSMGETTMSPYFFKSMTPSAFEAALRQKDGELASYVSRLASLESIRDSLSEELVKMTEQSEKLRAEVAVLPGIRAELEALRRRHSSALELMGERDEALEELRNDIADLKEMYREQVDLLVNKIQVLSSSAGAA